MNKVKLSEFVSRYGQRGAARNLGVTQPAIKKAMQAQREIYVTENADGTFSAKEVKDFPAIETKTRAI